MIEDIRNDHVRELEAKAKELIGVWIEDKDKENRLLYPYDTMTLDGDVILMCYDIPVGDYKDTPTIMDTDVYMSEFREFYRKSRRSGKKAWMKLRKRFDDILMGGE